MAHVSYAVSAVRNALRLFTRTMRSAFGKKFPCGNGAVCSAAIIKSGTLWVKNSSPLGSQNKYTQPIFGGTYGFKMSDLEACTSVEPEPQIQIWACCAGFASGHVDEYP